MAEPIPRPVVEKTSCNEYARASTQPIRRFPVDPKRIDELVDWALSRDWPADAGERIRREAWER